MRIALYNLEPKIVNAAMMKVSTYHKQQGDTVEQYKPILHTTYNKIYCFSILDFTDKTSVTPNMICGGTGFNISSKLPPEIERCEYDYSIFPECDHSLVWFSQGCIRNCPWCIVRQKEGYIHSLNPKNLNPKGQYIKIMDNNFFANPKWPEAIKQLQQWNMPCDFQGIDAHLLNQEQCMALKSVKHHKQIHIAWDNPTEDLEPKLRSILQYIKPYQHTRTRHTQNRNTPHTQNRPVHNALQQKKPIPKKPSPIRQLQTNIQNNHLDLIQSNTQKKTKQHTFRHYENINKTPHRKIQYHICGKTKTNKIQKVIYLLLFCFLVVWV